MGSRSRKHCIGDRPQGTVEVRTDELGFGGLLPIPGFGDCPSERTEDCRGRLSIGDPPQIAAHEL